MTTPPPGDQPLSRRELRERERQAAAAAASTGATPVVTGSAQVAPDATPPVLAPPMPTGPALVVPVESATALPAVSSFAPEAPPAYAPPSAPVAEPVAEVGETSLDRPMTRRELRALREAEERAALGASMEQAAPVEPVASAPAQPVVSEPVAEPVVSESVVEPVVEPVTPIEVVEAAAKSAPEPEAPVLSPYEEWQRRMGLRAAEQRESAAAVSEPVTPASEPVPVIPVTPEAAPEALPTVAETPAVQPWDAAPAVVEPEQVVPAVDETPLPPSLETNVFEAEPVVPLVEPVLPPPIDPWARQTELDQAVDTGAVSIESREFGSSPLITNALVIQPPTADAPMSPTGDILATGSIQLPPHYAQSGFSSPSYDTGEHDHLFDPGDSPLTNTDAQPVRAANAVSIHTESGGSLSLVPQRSNKGIIALVVIAGSMAVLVAGTLVVAIMTGQL